jgi:hypothetical protein
MQRTGGACRLPFLTIDARPAEINDRKVFGHWETDNYIGTNKEKAVLSVTTERLTRFTILEKLAGEEAHHKTTALIDRFPGSPTLREKLSRLITALRIMAIVPYQTRFPSHFISLIPIRPGKKGRLRTQTIVFVGTFPGGLC